MTHDLATGAEACPTVCPNPNRVGATTSSFLPFAVTGVGVRDTLTPFAFFSAASRSRTARASSSSRCLSYPRRLTRCSSSTALRCASSKLIEVMAFFAPNFDTLPPIWVDVVLADSRDTWAGRAGLAGLERSAEEVTVRAAGAGAGGLEAAGGAGACWSRGE